LALSADGQILSAWSRTAFSTNKPTTPMRGRPWITATCSWETTSWRLSTNHAMSSFLDPLALTVSTNVASGAGRGRGDLLLGDALGRRGQSLDYMKNWGFADVSPDGKTVVTTWEGTIYWWDLETGELLRTFGAHAGDVYQVGFLPDGTLVSAGDDGQVKFWDTPSDEETLLHSPASPPPLGPTLHLSPNLWMGFIGHNPPRPANRIVITNLITGAQHTIHSTNAESIGLEAFSSDGTRVSGRSGSLLKVWEVASGRELASFEGATHGGPLFSTFSRDGKRLVVGEAVWDLEPRVEMKGSIPDLPVPRTWPGPMPLEFSPEGQTLLLKTGDETFVMWDLDSKEIRDIPILRQSVFAFSPDWRLLAVVPRFGASAGPLVLVNGPPKEGRLILGRYTLLALAFSPDGKTLAGAEREGPIRFWQVASGDELFSVPTPGGKMVHQLTFTPDSRTLLASISGTVYAWRGARP
jgi:WD40 repeat protein